MVIKHIDKGLNGMRKVIISRQCSLIKSVKHFILIWIVFYAVRTQNIVFVYEIHKYTCKHTCTKYVMPIIAWSN